MKKVLVLIVILLAITNTAVFFYGKLHRKVVSTTTAKTGLVRGTSIENIDGVDHRVEVFFGSPSYTSLQEMLEDQGVAVYPEDRVVVFPEPSFGLGCKITIKRATEVLVSDGGSDQLVRTWQTTVKSLLEEKDITLGDKDRLEPVPESRLSQNLEIKITRVSVTEISEKEKIPYKTISREDADLEKGKTRVEQNGQEGIREKTYEVRRENSQEVARKLIKNEIVRPPQDKIIYKGTKTVVYGTGVATWYDWINGMTAASNTLSYGTKVLIINLANGKSVEVTIVDHGIQGEAIIDLSRDAFAKIGSLSQGKITVRLEKP